MKRVVLFPLLICVVVGLCVSYLTPLLLLSEINKGLILMLFASDCLSVALLVTLVLLVSCSMTRPQGGSIRTHQVTTKMKTMEANGNQMVSRKTSEKELWDFLEKFQKEVDTAFDNNQGGKHNV